MGINYLTKIKLNKMSNLENYNNQFQTLMNDLDSSVSSLYNESVNDFEDMDISTIVELTDVIEYNIETLKGILSQLKWKIKCQ
jgi:hypothetical protein